MELINGNNQCIFHQNQEPFPIFKKGRGSLCFVSYMPAMCLLQCLVTLKGHHITLWAILKGACHIKTNISKLLWTITKIYILLKVFPLWRPFHHNIALHYDTRSPTSVNMCFRLSLCHEDKWGEKWGRGIDSTKWKVSKHGVFSGPYFLVFGLNTGKYDQKKLSVSTLSTQCFVYWLIDLRLIYLIKGNLFLGIPQKPHFFYKRICLAY